jgi:ferric-dicitrate binding protein FerR (iron transport regulator)
MKREAEMNHEERLEKALEAIRAEAVPETEEQAARERVLEKLMASPEAVCAGFRAMLAPYAEGRLAKERQWLLEDHLGRCAACRRAFAELQGKPKVVAMPERRAALWQRVRPWAVAAGLAAVALFAGRDRIDRWMGPSGPVAVIEALQGPVFDEQGRALAAGAAVADDVRVRTGGGARLKLRLADGSRVEVNERSELALVGAWSGTTVRLVRGDVLVEAARQRRGALRVQAPDAEARVHGTVFAVRTGLIGSLVSVVEGTVEVRNAAGRRMLKPGELAATNPALEATSVRETVAWSSEAEKYFALLAEFASLEKQITALTSAPARTAPTVLAALPRGVMVYIAAPNLGRSMENALNLMSERAAQSPVFAEWWNAASTKGLREALGDLARISPMLGEEAVFVVAGGPQQPAPAVLAPVKAGMEKELDAALEEIRSQRSAPFVWKIAGGRLTVAPTQAQLDFVLGTAGQDAASPLAQEIARHYQRGTGWMAAFAPGAGMNADQPRVLLPRMVLFEQRRTPAGDENEMTLAYTSGASPAGWLAASGSSAAVEYFSGQAHVVFAASSREPRQIYDEFLAQVVKLRPEAASKIAEMESRLGLRLREDVASALGTDFAFGIEQPTLPVPGWLAVVETVRPAALDAAIVKVVDAVNAEMPADQASRRLTLAQETAGGRAWKTLRSGASANSVTWTYHAGFLVAGPDRPTVERAIATRESGLTLAQNAAFRTLLPASTGVHPAGFLWIQVGESLRQLAASINNPAVKTLLENRGPALVAFTGDGERIRAASRTSFASLLLDAMLASGAQSVTEPQAKQARKEAHAAAARR